MKLWQKIVLGCMIAGILSLTLGLWYLNTIDLREPSRMTFNNNCASCHAPNLRGTANGPPLIGRELKHGETIEQMMSSIAGSNTHYGNHDFTEKLPPAMIKALALYISERQQNFPTTTASFGIMPITDSYVLSRHHNFHVEKVASLESRPYSIAPLPDGRMLVAEKVRGLSVVDLRGRQGQPLADTPKVYPTVMEVRNQWLNLGIVLDLELHPDYENNGWIYLSHTDRCSMDCRSLMPQTMVRVVRGRIKDNTWIDQEVIWAVHYDHYNFIPDAVASGRLAFDGANNLYITVGGKNTYDKLHDLDTPYGKIHRVRDDGTVPKSNPFWQPKDQRPEGSTKHTVYSYGHRTGQGLATHPVTKAIWNTEMGPRGGDEINHIIGGANYGWPLYTNGIDYDGKRVTIGEKLGLDFPIESTELPLVDLTPAPALSNFTFHNGDKFRRWRHDLLVGSLKAGTLYRMRIRGGKLVESEKLLVNFGRMRDVVMGYDGAVYLAIEHDGNGSIWRLREE